MDLFPVRILRYWFQMGLMGFGTGFAVFLAGRPLVFERVFSALRRQIVFADIFVAYVLLHWTKESRFDWFWTDQGNEGLGAIANRCFFALPFLIANYRRLSTLGIVPGRRRLRGIPGSQPQRGKPERCHHRPVCHTSTPDWNHITAAPVFAADLESGVVRRYRRGSTFS